MKRLLMTLPAVAAVATVTVGVGSAATASARTPQAQAGTAQTQVATASPALTRYCVYDIRASDGLNLRSAPRSSSTALRWIPYGKVVTGPCQTTSGGSYNACGGSSTTWTKISYSGATGWGASRCVRFLHYAYE